MNRTELVQCFQDSVNASMDFFKVDTQNTIRANKVYKEGFTSSKRVRKEKYRADMWVQRDTTFNAAKIYGAGMKIAVLNFANPHHPGGGVANGAMAQEECLCRSSNLYPVISHPNVSEDYYTYHSKINSYFFSDRLIYSKNVVVFKDDSALPQWMPENEWFYVDVITCAAPYIGNREYTDRTALKEIFKKRIKNIFEAAIDNEVEVLILGAFGCGAFKNPPEVVAMAFREMIEQEDYDKYFKRIIFAIKADTERAMLNYQQFLTAMNMQDSIETVIQKLNIEEKSGYANGIY